MKRAGLEKFIQADEILIGDNVIIEEGVVIKGPEGPAKRVVIGDSVFIGDGTKIIVPEFRIGDYTKLHNHSFLYGYKPLQIGRNCWIGQNTILDSVGQLDIDDNVGIGAMSQIWTHIQFGDIVEGCRFNRSKYMHIGKDAWFVGHCIVSPVAVGERSMAMAGSVVTRDMEANHVYGGIPAKDLTAKLGTQFRKVTLEEKYKKLQELILAFEHKYPEFKGRLKAVRSPDQIVKNVTCFDVSRRVYTKRKTQAEIAFLKEHVPLIKFVPDGEGSFINLQKVKET